MSAGIGSLGNYEYKYFEVKADFIEGKTDKDISALAIKSAKEGHFAEAGALLRNVKDQTQKHATMGTVIDMIEKLNATQDPKESNQTKAYDGMHQFLDNLVVIDPDEGELRYHLSEVAGR